MTSGMLLKVIVFPFSLYFPDYCIESIDKLFEAYNEDPRLLRQYMDELKQDTPAYLSAAIQNKPNKDDAVKNFVTRYAKNNLVN